MDHPQRIKTGQMQQTSIQKRLRADSTPIPNQSNPSQHIKISVRLKRGIVTSLTIKKNIIALWIIFGNAFDDCEVSGLKGTEIIDPKNITAQMISDKVNDFVYKCLEGWDRDTGRGLSDFVTEKMIEDFLEDYEEYGEVIFNIK